MSYIEIGTEQSNADRLKLNIDEYRQLKQLFNDVVDSSYIEEIITSLCKTVLTETRYYKDKGYDTSKYLYKVLTQLLESLEFDAGNKQYHRWASEYLAKKIDNEIQKTEVSSNV